MLENKLYLNLLALSRARNVKGTVMMNLSLSPSELEIYNSYAGKNLPRHTSYPAAPFWKSDTKELTLFQILGDQARSTEDFSLYIHIPYCRSLCYYCGCNKEIYDDERMKKKDPRETFLGKISNEIQFYKKFFLGRKLKQIHLGGGTPTFLSASQLSRLMDEVYKAFELSTDPEVSIEVDPRVTTKKHLDVLKKQHFNRISLGVQDFDFKVQKAVNRVQSFSLVKSLVEECRKRDFAINFDLIYGLPYQTKESMTETLGKVLTLSPDRIAFYRLAMIPQMFRWQRSFQRCDLPEEEKLLEINLLAIKTFTEHGYHFIGLDHFAKESDELTKASKDGSLRRNFQGMTTHNNLEILGIGPSSISQFHSSYIQRTKDNKTWLEASNNSFLFEKFCFFTEDDVIRKELISNLYCFGTVDKKALEEKYKISFETYFAKEKTKIEGLIKEGIVEEKEDKILLKGLLGRLLVRAVAACFDAYLGEEEKSEKGSRVLFSKLG